MPAADRSGPEPEAVCLIAPVRCSSTIQAYVLASRLVHMESRMMANSIPDQRVGIMARAHATGKPIVTDRVVTTADTKKVLNRMRR